MGRRVHWFGKGERNKKEKVKKKKKLPSIARTEDSLQSIETLKQMGDIEAVGAQKPFRAPGGDMLREEREKAVV